MRVRGIIVVGLVLGIASLLAAQERPREVGDALSAPPPTPQPVLEVAAGLSRPVPRGGFPEPVPVMAASAPFQMERAATERRPVGLALSATGPVAASVQSLLATDLAYARELRLQDDGELVVTAETARTGGAVEVKIVLGHRDPERPGSLVRQYRGPETGLAARIHEVADDLLYAVTGTRGAFATRLLFARRDAPGRKDVFIMHADGSDLERITDGQGISAFPAYGPDGVYYSVITPLETFITRTGLGGRPVIGGPGTHMGPTVCGDRLFFASTRDGNTDIWSAALDGSGEARLTEHPGIEVSPVCMPNDRVGFISDRTRLPQVWSMNRDGGDERMVVRRTTASQTPSWCGDRVALTAVGGGRPMRVVVYDVRTETERQLSPARAGAFKDPAFSPDCRMIAWVSPEGIEVVRSDGRHRRLIAAGAAETLRWIPAEAR